MVSASLDTVDMALEYLELRFKEIIERLVEDQEGLVVLVLDNIQGICPKAEE